MTVWPTPTNNDALGVQQITFLLLTIGKIFRRHHLPTHNGCPENHEPQFVNMTNCSYFPQMKHLQDSPMGRCRRG